MYTATIHLMGLQLGHWSRLAGGAEFGPWQPRPPAWLTFHLGSSCGGEDSAAGSAPGSSPDSGRHKELSQKIIL